MSNKRTAIGNLQTGKIQVVEPEERPPERSPRIRAVVIKPPSSIEETLALRDAPPPPEGYRYTMDGRLVPAQETELPIDDPEAQEIFCEVIELTGSLRAACDSLGIRSIAKVKRYIDRNPLFMEQVEVAAERHRQSLYAHAVQRATVGYLKPVIGGKEKDKIVAYERVVSDSLLQLLLKRHFPEFREANKAAVTVNNNTVNIRDAAKSMTREERDRIRAIMEKRPPEPDREGIIDVEPNDPDKGQN